MKRVARESDTPLSIVILIYNKADRVEEPARRLSTVLSAQGIDRYETIFIGSVQLSMFGVMGEYVGRIYEELKRRPLYIVQERVGFSDAEGGPT
jgi:hypothetical protein